jgi:hypothetical protein
LENFIFVTVDPMLGKVIAGFGTFITSPALRQGEPDGLAELLLHCQREENNHWAEFIYTPTIYWTKALQP